MRGMRVLPALSFMLLLVLSLAACKREPDFDERYEAANTKVRQTAQEIDAQIAGTGTPPDERR